MAMNTEERLEARKSTQARRRPPGGVHTIHVDLESGGQLPETMDQRFQGGCGPWEVHVTATDPEGTLSPWFDEDWWTDLIAQAPEDHVTVRFTPSPRSIATMGCLIHPIVLRHVRMLRRVVPRWRLVGCGHADEVRSDEDVRELAGSLYHEVRIQDRPDRAEFPSTGLRLTGLQTTGLRAGDDKQEANLPTGLNCSTSPRTCEQLFADVRRAQTELGVSTPILIRVPSGDGDEAPPSPMEMSPPVEAPTPLPKVGSKSAPRFSAG